MHDDERKDNGKEVVGMAVSGRGQVNDYDVIGQLGSLPLRRVHDGLTSVTTVSPAELTMR